MTKEFSNLLARIDKKIADIEALQLKSGEKIDRMNSWLNLYEVSPHLAMRNPHLGIVKHQEQ